MRSAIIKAVTVAALMLLLTPATVSCMDSDEHEHTPVKTDSEPATCTEAGNHAYWTCSECGRIFYDEACAIEITESLVTVAPIAHSWLNADCITPRTCSECGAIDGAPLGHAWDDADCFTPKTCARCGDTEGEQLLHAPGEDDGDCTTPVICKRCEEVTTPAAESHVPRNDDKNCETELTCQNCDAIITEARMHDFSGAWHKDADGHLHVCKNDNCSKTDENRSHVSSGAPTEDAAEVCTVCGYIINAALGHVHVEDTARWESDETHHWHDCISDDGKQYGRAEHSYDGAHDTACKCGHRREVEYAECIDNNGDKYCDAYGCGKYVGSGFEGEPTPLLPTA